MNLKITAEERSLLIDLLALARAHNLLPSDLYPFFWKLSSGWQPSSLHETEGQGDKDGGELGAKGNKLQKRTSDEGRSSQD
jgi:hypothetical protein